MKIFIASDHGGYKLKEVLKDFLKSLNYKFEDLGTYNEEPVDYPDYTKKLCLKVLKYNGKGILICGAGIGTSIAANKFKGIRAALCHDTYSARMSRDHNNANVLCLGGRVLGNELAKDIVRIWLETPFSRDERHIRRLNKIEKY